MAEMVVEERIGRHGPNLRYNKGYDCWERRCTKCGEWWPSTTEFFEPKGKRGLCCWCRDCKNQYIASLKRRRAA